MELRSAYLFYGDGDLSNTEYKLLSILKIAMEEAELEQYRIKSNLERMNAYRKLQRKIGKKKAQAKLFEENNLIYEEVMADIHLWLIAWGNIHKALNRLQGIRKDDCLNKTLEKYKEWFLKTRKARNSLEHVDERVLNSPKWYLDYSDLRFSFIKNSFEIFGLEIKFNASTFKMLERVTKDLNVWYSSLPSEFVSLLSEYSSDHPSKD